jgi:hypothetical protein
LFDRAVKAEKNIEQAGTGVFAAVDTFQGFTLDVFGVVNLWEELNHPDSITFDGAKKKETEHTDWTFHRAYEIIFASGPLGGVLMFANEFLSVRWLPLKENRDSRDACAFLRATLKMLIVERIRAVPSAMRAGTY